MKINRGTLEAIKEVQAIDFYLKHCDLSVETKASLEKTLDVMISNIDDIIEAKHGCCD